MIVVVMVAACIVLVAISYLMLNVLSNMVITPKTTVEVVEREGELFLPLEGVEVLSMQISADGSYLACTLKEQGGGTVLRVLGLGAGGRTVFEQGIGGVRIAWLGSTASLAYEDAGDIWLLDVTSLTRSNLTASPELDSEPIPSPDGRYILWTVASADSTGDEPAFWLMRADGSEKGFLAKAQPLAVWDASGGRVMSRRATAISAGGESSRYFLETAVPGKPGWEQFVECEGEVTFIWWPSRDTVLYVGPVLVKEQDVVKGVWTRAEQPDKFKKVASTDGLGFERSHYLFYPSRTEEWLAYVGIMGLEYLDYGERVIYRYPDLEACTPLAWNEDAEQLFYIGPRGIYRVEAGGG
ncbi:MAG: hypothetical protein AB1384_03985 [Actinomycetota bacterium]